MLLISSRYQNTGLLLALWLIERLIEAHQRFIDNNVIALNKVFIEVYEYLSL